MNPESQINQEPPIQSKNQELQSQNTEQPSLINKTINVVNNVAQSSSFIMKNYLVPFTYKNLFVTRYITFEELLHFKDLGEDKKNNLISLHKQHYVDDEQCFILGSVFTGEKELLDLLLFYWSRIYCTYRTNFNSLKGQDVEYNTDCGWGCTYRTAQSLLVQAFVKTKLGHNWKLSELKTDEQKTIYKNIIYEFTEDGKFRLENLTNAAKELGGDVGKWVGPSTISQILKKVIVKNTTEIDVYLNIEGVVYKDAFNFNNNKSILILLPTRLGIENINPIYYNGLKACFSCKYCIGMVGGKASSSLYYVGCIDEKVLYLDPHISQESIKLQKNSATIKECESYHYYGSPLQTHMKLLDPNILVGFIIKNKEEFEEFCNKFESLDNSTSFFHIFPQKTPFSNSVDNVLDYESFEDE